MKRHLIALAAILCLAPAASALDLDQMTDAERAAFQSQIRAYLLENPEVIMEAIGILEERQAAAQAQGDMDLVRANAEDIFNDGHSWVGGNPDGDITLVEFLDYRCGYCRRAFDEVKTLLEEDGNIRFVVKEFPILGEESTLAAQFAIATQQVEGPDAYKAVHDTLMAYNGSVSTPAMVRMANTLGLNGDAIAAHMDSHDVAQVIAQNHQLARRLSISGTPSFVMDQHMLRGYLPASEMLKLAEEIRTQ